MFKWLLGELNPPLLPWKGSVVSSRPKIQDKPIYCASHIRIRTHIFTLIYKKDDVLSIKLVTYIDL